jgi:hypothetical protein
MTKAIRTYSEPTVLTSSIWNLPDEGVSNICFPLTLCWCPKSPQTLKFAIIVAGDPGPNPHPCAILSKVFNPEPEPFPFFVPVKTGDEMAVTTVMGVFVVWVPSLGAVLVVTALPFMAVWQ